MCCCAFGPSASFRPCARAASSCCGARTRSPRRSRGPSRSTASTAMSSSS
ncbi:MAG: general secretion pathway protein GspL [Planctomycetes bacterium]|nr:general secretion pathway protein GspL [Planctomycetota bacterium]